MRCNPFRSYIWPTSTSTPNIQSIRNTPGIPSIQNTPGIPASLQDRLTTISRPITLRRLLVTGL
jgi:hypothetical protein